MKSPEWAIELAKLDSDIFGYVKINADGHIVTFQNILSKRSLVTCWYLDGIWKGEYSRKEDPIGQKFGRPIIIKRNRKHLEIIRRVDGKKAYDSAKKEKIICGFSNAWNSSKALISHLKTTCKSIELVKPLNV